MGVSEGRFQSDTSALVASYSASPRFRNTNSIAELDRANQRFTEKRASRKFKQLSFQDTGDQSYNN